MSRMAKMETLVSANVTTPASGPSPKHRKPDEGLRIRQKHPTRVPVICVPLEERAKCRSGHELREYVRACPGSNTCDRCERGGIAAPEKLYRCEACDFDLCTQCYMGKAGSMTCKLLVPGSMPCSEFVKIAREKCRWAKEDSLPFVGGSPLPDDETMSALDQLHKAADGFFYVTVAGKESVAQLKQAEAAEAADDLKPGETSPDSKQQAPIFHMPDLDPESADAVRAKRVLQKYPDRVPVLFRQGPVAGLPAIDKKLLVPHQMCSEELKWVLKKQFPAPAADVDWDGMCIVVNDVQLKPRSLIKDVYDQYKDCDECLHITLALESDTMLAQYEPEVLEQSLKDNDLRESLEGKNCVELQAALDEARENAAAAEEARKVAEERANVEAEKAEHFAQAYVAEAETNKKLEEERKEDAQRDAEKFSIVEEALKMKEEQLKAEVDKTNQMETALTEIDELRVAETIRATRSESMKDEAERKATLEAEKAATFESLLKAREEKLKFESCEKSAVEMELARLRAELQDMKKKSDEDARNISELARKAAHAEDECKVFKDRAARAEHILKTLEDKAALEAQQIARAQERDAQEFVHVSSDSAAAVDDWACI